MSKVAYLIITDMHESPKFKGRVNYSAEVDYTRSRIISMIGKYRSKGYDVNLIFLGDIFDRGYRNVEDALNACMFYMTLSDYVSNVYTLVGNHEITYNRNNPFWFMVSDMDTSIIRRDKIVSPRGFKDVFKIRDVITEGNVSFYCNHYGTGTTVPEDRFKYNIGLYHQDIIYKKALDIARLKGDERYYDYVPVVSNDKVLPYELAFAGHNHTIVGKITVNDCLLYNLGTLNRTSSIEVDNRLLERMIPAVLIEDGEFVCVEDNPFDLMKREECVIEEEILEAKNKRDKLKECREFISSYNTNDNPIQNLKDNLQIPLIHIMIDEILEDKPDSFFDREDFINE